jgi:NAD(P)-dependent dehydrogenase (short-subunit alcohol dehydrogenase family)
MHASLQGRTALVTGAGRGIGRSIALTLAQAGADVALNFRRDDTAARDVAVEIERLGRRAQVYQAAVEDRAACAAMAAAALADFGAIDILVNNAGIGSRGQTVAESDLDEVERLLRVHALGPYHLSQLLLPQMRTRGRGDIVMISSIATRLFSAHGSPYSMAKAAMEALALTLAKEERRHGIRTNIVSPSLTVTDMGQRLARARGNDDIHSLDAAAPFGRLSVPQDVASVVLYLVSGANFYVNGQNIAVDGGG